MRLIEPTSIPEAIEALSADEFGAKVIAGGTAVVLMMQQGLIQPEMLVSLQRIPDLRYVDQEDDAVIIGAGATLREVAASPLVREQHPSLAYACQRVANVRIRNVATLGGNLAEADYASDPPCVLVALDATVRIGGPHGERESAVADLLTGFYTTTLEPNEVITSIRVVKRSSASRDVYLKYLSRSSEDRPCVGVAAAVSFAKGDRRQVERLRVAVGAATATPRRYPEIEVLATGTTLSDDVIARIADGYADQIEPIDDLRGSAWYRKQMTRTFVRRALVAVRASGPEGA